jgi:hypothetical protein
VGAAIGGRELVYLVACLLACSLACLLACLLAHLLACLYTQVDNDTQFVTAEFNLYRHEVDSSAARQKRMATQPSMINQRHSANETQRIAKEAADWLATIEVPPQGIPKGPVGGGPGGGQTKPSVAHYPPAPPPAQYPPGPPKEGDGVPSYNPLYPHSDPLYNSQGGVTGVTGSNPLFPNDGLHRSAAQYNGQYNGYSKKSGVEEDADLAMAMQLQVRVR